jgi:AraC-like DNA-binding protein
MANGSPHKSITVMANALLITCALVSASCLSGMTQERVQDMTPHRLQKNLADRTFSGRHIDLVFSKAGLQEVIAVLEKTGGISLKLAPDINDPVTYRMLDVPWDEALAAVLSDNGLFLMMNLDESGFKIGRGEQVVLAFPKASRAKIVMFLYKYLVPIGIGIILAILSPFVLRPIRKLLEARNRNRKKSLLPPEDIAEVKEKLLRVMKENRLYRNTDLTLQSLAENLGVTSHQLSWVVNEVMGLSFSSLVNGWRVEEVKRFLARSDSNGTSILQAAMEAGFNSKAAFNRAFKVQTGMTPSEYKKRLLR